MSVSALSSTSGSAANGTPATGTAAEGEQRFLKLLVTQLNNQDPLNPLDNAQLTSQLAQMSTVSGIEKLNAALQSLIAQSSSGQMLQAASMVGRTVLVPGDRIALEPGTPVSFAIVTGAASDAALVDIVDAGGRVVRHLDLGGLAKGMHEQAWDGLDDAGQAVPAGSYTLRTTASDGGTAVSAGALVFEPVRSVALGSGGFALGLDGQRLARLDEVWLIR